MFGFNDQVPGPIIKVKQGSTIFVNFTNNLDMDSSIHWHGLKLNNKYDGVPGLTQAPLKPGQSFLYKLVFPNEGVYWYHSHYREDEQQGLGMYGIMLVEPKAKNYYNPVDLEVSLTLADLLIMLVIVNSIDTIKNNVKVTQLDIHDYCSIIPLKDLELNVETGFYRLFIYAF